MMPIAALAPVDPAARRPVAGAPAQACAEGEHVRPPARYRRQGYPVRFVALGVAAVLHVLAAAVLIHGWSRPEPTALPDEAIVVTLLPLARDEPARKPEPGVASRKESPKPPLPKPPPPLVPVPPSTTVKAAEPAAEPPAPADGGREDRLAQVTQAYRRAITARLATQRHYPEAALIRRYQGNGAILFRIDRDGRLLDVSVEASTGRRVLDRAAMAQVRRAAPFPAIPAELPDELAIALPVQFLILEPGMQMAAR